MSRNLDASVAGVARISFWDRLWTRPRARVRTERARVREGREGSVVSEDGPATAIAGSSKSKVRGLGADVDGLTHHNTTGQCVFKNLRRRGTEDAALSSSIAAQADWEFCH
jgi:hypothetical protein